MHYVICNIIMCHNILLIMSPIYHYMIIINMLLISIPIYYIMCNAIYYICNNILHSM